MEARHFLLLETLNIAKLASWRSPSKLSPPCLYIHHVSQPGITCQPCQITMHVDSATAVHRTCASTWNMCKHMACGLTSNNLPSVHCVVAQFTVMSLQIPDAYDDDSELKYLLNPTKR